MTISKYCAVYRDGISYCVASQGTPDQREHEFSTKLEALLAARDYQMKNDRDPNFVLDLTNCDRHEIREFLS